MSPVRLVLTRRDEGTFYAELELAHGNRRIAVDCRPSDGIAVAIRLGIPVVAASALEPEFEVAGGARTGQSVAASDLTRPAAILKVSSVHASVRRYRQLGFDVRPAAVDADATWAEVERDGLVLQLLGGNTPWSSDPGFTGSFYVHTDSVQAVHDAAAGVVPIEWGVEVRPWGALELTLQDPDGYFLTFTQPAP